MTCTDRPTLLARWTELLPAAPGLGDRLLDRWSEPHRHYHTCTHLAEVLDAVDRFAEADHDHQLVALAAWYHDAVYRIPPGPAGNEEDSARLAEAELPPYLPADRVAAVARLVRVTADHRAAPGDADAALLCDADLAILAADPERYRAYARAIRAEYQSVPDDRFRQGRRAVLAGLLSGAPLFRTRRGAPLESAARRNVTAEIADLAQ